MCDSMSEKLRGIVRIAGADIKGEKKLYVSLQRIKGIGPALANAICKISNMDRNRRVGTLTDEEIKKLEEIMNNPIKFGIPSWMLNKRLDPETGKDSHIFGPTLKFIQQQDIKRMMEIRTYKGIRHGLGLPVRGQRTKSSFRKGRSVGVVRKKQMPAKAKK
jgi:small subunit ribosomal protein S13